MDLSPEHCLKSLGISLLSELDVLVFVHRRKTSLTSVKQISSLIGHDQAAVSIALGQLEREMLIEPSIASQGWRASAMLLATREPCRNPCRAAAIDKTSETQGWKAGR
jgi:DNA-binding MarR family transcriptional regulator